MDHADIQHDGTIRLPDALARRIPSGKYGLVAVFGDDGHITLRLSPPPADPVETTTGPADTDIAEDRLRTIKASDLLTGGPILSPALSRAFLTVTETFLTRWADLAATLDAADRKSIVDVAVALTRNTRHPALWIEPQGSDGVGMANVNERWQLIIREMPERTVLLAVNEVAPE